MNKTLVTGGSGLVGKYLKEIIPDALYLSSKDYDLTDYNDILKMFNDHNPDTIIHLAARVGGIIDNIERPYDYYTDNVLMNTFLLDCARKFEVDRFIGVLSTCIFPDTHHSYPMKEEDMHAGPPAPTNFSYGYSKRSMAVQIDACNKQYGTNYQYMTPCNLYGKYDNFDNEKKAHFVTALIKKIDIAKRSNSNHIQLFGTGKPMRQFMNAKDFASIIKLSLDNGVTDSFNVSISENLSIREIAEQALIACDAEHLEIRFDETKPDGQFRKDVSNEKMLSIFPDFDFTPLNIGIKEVYDHIKKS